MSSSRFRVPHTLVLLFGMVVVAQILTYILPTGEFERQTTEVGREEVVAGSYGALTEVEPLSPLASLTAIPKGLAAAQDIIYAVTYSYVS